MPGWGCEVRRDLGEMRRMLCDSTGPSSLGGWGTKPNLGSAVRCRNSGKWAIEWECKKISPLWLPDMSTEPL